MRLTPTGLSKMGFRPPEVRGILTNSSNKSADAERMLKLRAKLERETEAARKRGGVSLKFWLQYGQWQLLRELDELAGT
jgi:hypothetical protein